MQKSSLDYVAAALADVMFTDPVPSTFFELNLEPSGLQAHLLLTVEGHEICRYPFPSIESDWIHFSAECLPAGVAPPSSSLISEILYSFDTYKRAPSESIADRLAREGAR